MVDNRTTELLREGLTERGIKWRSGLEGVTFVGDWCFVEYDNGRLAATCEPVLTPEQAIAATLGDEIPKKCSTCQYRYVVGQRPYPTFGYMCGFGDGKKLCGDDTSVLDHMGCEHWEKELR